MKFTTALAVVVFAAAIMFQTAAAQSPNQTFGLGVNVGSYNGAVDLSYAISPAIHIGTDIGIILHSQNSSSTNIISFSPFGRFLLKGTKEFKPYLYGQFNVLSGGGTTQTGLDIGGGGFYFPSSTLALFGQISVVSLGFDPSVTDIGFHSSRCGIIWFFN